MKLSKLHVIYSLLLAHCFGLRPEDERALKKTWGFTDQEIYGAPVEWLHQPPPRSRCVGHVRDERVTLQSEMPAGHSWHRPLCRAAADTKAWQAVVQRSQELCRCAQPIAPRPLKICSMPGPVQQVIAANLLAQDFDLEGVPGFYREDLTKLPADPGDYLLRWLKERCGPWRLNLNYRAGLLVPYTNGTPWIVGLKIYRGLRDRQPTVLTSRGLPGGAKAIGVVESIAA